MRTQQQAERAEQQRIKNLVLNYDLSEDQQDGEAPAFLYVTSPNSKRTRLVGTGSLNKSLRSLSINALHPQSQSQHSTVAKKDDDSNKKSQRRAVSSKQ